jgi:LmbE family N-acetylglucosaminyl deacetylase
MRSGRSIEGLSQKMTDGLGRHVVVLSPHLDDAILSLGGTIARASRSGARIQVVTIFANDPNSTAPPGPWDAVCGFTTAGEAARLRREEDRRGCELLGAETVWLPFADYEYEQDFDDDGLWDTLAIVVQGADTVLTPGFPLAAPDHARLTKLLLARPLPGVRLALYVEQPYATWRLIGRGQRTGAQGLTPRQGIENLFKIALRTAGGRRLQMPSSPDAKSVNALEWIVSPMGPRNWWAKQRAIRAYRSQVKGFGPLVISRIVAYERGWGGEAIAWLPKPTTQSAV